MPWHWYLGKAGNHTGRKPNLTWQRHASEENFARNVLKHIHDTEVVAIPFGLENAAAMMLYRAITNYKWLGLEKSWRMVKFERWFWKWAV